MTEFAPPRILTKKEQRAFRKRLEELGRDGLIEELIEKGWLPESVEILADAMLKPNQEISDGLREFSRIDILFYVSILLMSLGLVLMVMFGKDTFMFGGLMVGVGMFSMLLILVGKIFTTIVDGLVREY